MNGIIHAADSETGQSVLRDLIMSFELPLSVVGIRRGLLLPRSVNAKASRDYTSEVSSAHETAMRGAEWAWLQEDEEVLQICALLAGLSMILAPPVPKNSASHKIQDAFGGKVLLPFLECPSSSNQARCIGLVPNSNEWIVYSLSSKGKMYIYQRVAGVQGLADCILMLTTDLSHA